MRALGLRSISPNASSSSLRYEYGIEAANRPVEEATGGEQISPKRSAADLLAATRLSPTSSSNVLRSAYDAAPRARSTDAFRRASPSPPPQMLHTAAIPIHPAAPSTVSAFGASGLGGGAMSPSVGPASSSSSSSTNSFGLGPSPAVKLTIGGIARGPFDSTPSFSSPLAQNAALADPDTEDGEEAAGVMAQQQAHAAAELADRSSLSQSPQSRRSPTMIQLDATRPKSSEIEPERWQPSGGRRTTSGSSVGGPSDESGSSSFGRGGAVSPDSPAAAFAASRRSLSGGRQIKGLSSVEIKFLPRDRIASGGNPIPSGSMGPPPLPFSSVTDRTTVSPSASGSFASKAATLPRSRPVPAALAAATAHNSPSSSSDGSSMGNTTINADPTKSDGLSRAHSISTSSALGKARGTAPLAIANSGRTMPASGSQHGSTLSVSSNVSVSSNDSLASASPSQGGFAGSMASLATSWGGASMSSGGGGSGAVGGDGGPSANLRRSIAPPTSLSATAAANLSGGGRRKRRPSAPAAPSASAHRRARSLGGVLLADLALAQSQSNAASGSNASNDASSSSPNSSRSFLGGYVGSPIGGPDGVDPNLIAAISGNDASIPGTPAHEHLRLYPAVPVSGPASASAVAPSPNRQDKADARDRSKTTSSGSPVSQSSSTGLVSRSGSMSSGVLLHRKRSDLLSVMPDTRVLSTNYPLTDELAQTDADGEAQGQGFAPSPPIGGPEGYRRLRARSQTIAPLSLDSKATAAASSSAHLATSIGSSPRVGGSLGPRSAGSLAEAIRLQRVPTSVRLAGDLFNPPSPATSKPGLPMPQQSLGLGIGVGQGGSSDSASGSSGTGGVFPQTPSATRNASFSDLTQGQRSDSPKSGGESPTLSGVTTKTSRKSSGANDEGSLRVSIPRRRFSALPGASLSAFPTTNPPSAFSTSPNLTRQQQPTMDRASERSSHRRSMGASLGPLFSLPSSPQVPGQGPASRKGSGGDGKEDSAFGECAVLPFHAVGDLTLSVRCMHVDEDPAARPAPWIASSQEVRLRPQGMSRVDTWAPGMSGPATDEYARIIVASRNAKMQKWKNSNSMSYRSSSPALRPGLARAETMGGRRASQFDPQSERESPSAGALMEHRGSGNTEPIPEGNQDPDFSFERGEVEWVDWLDEYQKMKEAKVRTEKEEEKKKAAKSTDALDTEPEASSDETTLLAAPTNTHLKPTSPNEPRLTKSSSQSQILGSGEGARRPSESPRPSSPKPVGDQSARKAKGAVPSSPRLMPASESWLVKQRSTSSSPIVVRTAGTNADRSQALTTGRRRRHLGGKIEAWWSAVKSGFSAQAEDVSGNRVVGLPQRPKPERKVITKTSDAPAVPATRVRSHSIKAPEASASARALRVQTSARTLKTTSPEATATTPLVDDVLETPQAIANRESLPSLRSVPGSDLSKNEGHRKRHPPLSLNLDKRISTFASSQFDKSDAELEKQPSERKQSPPPSPRDTRKLSQPWSRAAPSSASSSDRSPFEIVLAGHRDSARSRDMSLHTPPTMTHSKDITINYMRQQIRQRLATSKNTCDHALRRIVAAINAFVEQSLQTEEPDVSESEDAYDPGSDMGELSLGESALQRSASGQSGKRDSGLSPDPRTTGPSESTFDPDETAHGTCYSRELDAGPSR